GFAPPRRRVVPPPGNPPRPTFAPVQAVVLTITEAYNDWAIQVQEQLRAAGLRVETDLRNQKISYKIREHAMKKTPWLLIVGEREQAEGAVSPRNRSGQELGLTSIDMIKQRLVLEASTRTATQ
ncbi:MAG: hypothetical protein HQL94_09940, partial [Magnetococcales bacterium]|nr:hypothetical protein [Magnetococcales bacterium]